MAEIRLDPELLEPTRECVEVRGHLWDCYWSWEGETKVDGEYFPEIYCRFDKLAPCEPCKICTRYVRRDKIDDYIRHLLEELDHYYKLP